MIADHYIIEKERLKYKKRNNENSTQSPIPNKDIIIYLFDFYKIKNK
jgi:hypothetical protein